MMNVSKMDGWMDGWMWTDAIALLKLRKALVEFVRDRMAIIARVNF